MATDNWRYYHKKEYRPCQKKRSARIFVLLLLLLSLWYAGEEERIITISSLYQPTKEVSRLIDENAARYSLSRELLQSVILVESKYNNEAVSSTGALGVMQLMPDTADWIAEESGLPSKNLKNPEENIPLGAWYLNFLIAKYDGNLVLALAAYNAGRGNVDGWMKTNKWPPDYANIDGIPFPETREFVRSVIQNRDRMVEENKK